MLLTVILLSVVLVALSFAGLGLTILVRKNGRFPQTEVGSNKDMKKLGITCAKQDEIKLYREMRKSSASGREKVQLPVRDCGLGCSCVPEEF